MSTDLLALMQVVDGAFPTGAFAHSLGLETYVQAGTVHDGASFGEFLRTSLHLGVGASDAIALSVAHRAARNGDWGAVREADELLTAMKLPEETRTAGLRLGKRFLVTCEAVFDLEAIRRLRESVEPGDLAGQHAVAFGAVTALLGASLGDAARAYLHGHAMSQASAAVRLVPLGATAAQRVVRSLHGDIVAITGLAVTCGIDDMTSFTPGLDIASMRHADLPARLFMS
jgi:urease accessory protein